MFHGGVLAMREFFFSEINFAKDASYSHTSLHLLAKQAAFEPQTTLIHCPAETAPVRLIVDFDGSNSDVDRLVGECGTVCHDL
jgi:hypothetical protein